MKVFKIGVLLGSARPTGNSHGLFVWLKHYLIAAMKDSDGLYSNEELGFDFVTIYPDVQSDPNSTACHPIHPLGPVLQDTISALVSDEEGYTDPNVQQWSRLVASCKGFLILTPQFNWGYPGDLKNAMDHLYHEWRDKPVLLVTYGGHGGGKCGAQLRQVLEGLHMRVVADEVSIHLPGEYIRGNSRVLPGDLVTAAVGLDTVNTNSVEMMEMEVPEFLRGCEKAVHTAGNAFVKLLLHQ